MKFPGPLTALGLLTSCVFACGGPPPQEEPRETRTVRGASMTGVLAPGQEITLLRGYYQTHAPERGDLAVIDGKRKQLVKAIRGVPGDQFAVVTEAGQGRLIINGEVARTSSGEPFSLNAKAQRMLNLYVRDYGGRIPANAYLVLGNLANGSFDSTRFGLVDISDLLGKAVTGPRG